ncbi:hypothetical protein K7432_018131, partial [Basidiobolus ranarum]
PEQLLPGESMLLRRPSSPNSSSTGVSSPFHFLSLTLSHVMSRRQTMMVVMRRENSPTVF